MSRPHHEGHVFCCCGVWRIPQKLMFRSTRFSIAMRSCVRPLRSCCAATSGFSSATQACRSCSITTVRLGYYRRKIRSFQFYLRHLDLVKAGP